MIHRTLLSIALTAVILSTTTSVFSEDASAGKQVAQSLSDDDAVASGSLRYWLYLPKNYSDADNLPLMLFLHGAGERGDDLDVVKKWGPPKLIDQGEDFPFIVASPQCPKQQFWDIEQLVDLVNHLSENYKVDVQRIYCTGLSMGGYGTWTLLAAHPELFAAGAPICGGGRSDGAETLKNIPIWAFHGDADSVVPVSRSQEMVDAIKGAGGTKVKLTVYPGVNHNSWTPAYADPELYRWLLSQQRAD